jgi:hypothetical protein
VLKRLRLVTGLALVAGLLAPAPAAATGVVAVEASRIIYFAARGDVDQIAISDTSSAVRFTRLGGAEIGPGPGCEFAGLETVVCQKAGVASIVMDLADGDDIAVVSPGVTLPVTLDGADGNDRLTGGAGADTFAGGPGNDNLVARDGRGEQVDCGGGTDTATLDDADVRISCEAIEGDADADGVRAPIDCDDTTPRIRPGVVDIPGNGIDEDCSGLDAVDPDRDRDGSPRPVDCDDSNPAVRPGVAEIPGNAVDENCDTRAEPFAPIAGSVVDGWDRVGTRLRNVRLTAKGFPVGTAVTLHCSGRGCPFTITRMSVRSPTRPLNLHRLFGARTLRPGLRLELSFALPDRVGRVLRYRVTARGLPEFEFLCLPPGGMVRDC